MKRGAFLLLLPTLLFVPGLAQGQDPAPAERPRVSDLVERTEVRVLLVDVFITDRKGNPVPGLRREDFRLFLDGNEVEIDSFEYREVPAGGAVPSAATAEALPAGEAPVVGGTREKIVLLFDAWNSTTGGQQRVREQAIRFLQSGALPEGDAMILSLADRLHIVQDLTSDRTALFGALERFTVEETDLDSFRNGVAERLRQIEDASRGPGGCAAVWNLVRAFAEEERRRAERALRVLEAVVYALGGLKGRKSVVYFSEGIDSPPGATYLQTAVGVGCGDSASAGNPAGFETGVGFDDLYDAANAANVTFHTVDARTSELGTQTFLSGLAIQTGGVRGTAARAPAEHLARVARQMASFYVLGHTLPSSHPDGAVHSIRVEVDRPGVEPRYRQKFADLGWREREDRSVLGAVALPELHRDLPLQVRAMPFRKGEQQFAVYFEVGLPVADLFWLPFRLEELGEVEFAGLITDARGRIEHEFRDVLEVKRAGSERRRDDAGLFYRGRADLGPGRYELTAVAHDLGGGRIGATRFGFEVPEPAGADFSLGGLVLGKLARGDLVVGAYSPYPEKRKSLPKKFRREVVVPLLADDLTTGDVLLTYLEVYDPRKDARDPPLSLEVSMAFLREGEVFAEHRPIPMETNPDAEEEGGTLSFAMVTPLQTFDPGPYDLRVEVVDRAGNRRLVREIPLRILAAQIPATASP